MQTQTFQSKQTYSSDICIVGNGAVGKAAALGFAQAGLKVVLVCPEITLSGVQKLPASVQSVQHGPDGEPWDVRVFALNRVAHDLLTGLKVWDALDLTRVTPVSAMHVQDSSSVAQGYAENPVTNSENPAAKICFDAYSAKTEQMAWILEDKNLNRALDTALKFAQNLQMVQGKAVQLDINQQAATLHLESGIQISTALVIGADGAQSWVRAQAEIGYSYRSYAQRGVVTNFFCEKPHHGVAHQWFVEGLGIIALLPLSGQRVSLVWSAPDALATELMKLPLDQLARRLHPYAAEALGQLTPVLPEAIQAFPLQLKCPHSIIAQRIALIGDAAHVVHPLAGHGMNLGFADVQTLLDLVTTREAFRDCGDEKLLQRYRRARREDIALMQLTTDGLARLFGSEMPVLRGARQIGLNLLNHLPVLKRALLSHAMGRR